MKPGERLYLETEPDPAVAARHVGRYERAIKLAGRTGGTWLDFACGSGYGSQIIDQVADETLAIDRSYKAIHYALKNHSGPDYMVGGIDRVRQELTRRQVDVVCCIETLEHLLESEQRVLLRTIRDGLAPGGVLVLACPIGNGYNPRNPYHLHEPSLGQLTEYMIETFPRHSLETEEYESTSGPAVQAWAVAHV